jgi:hypothetical protein
MRPHESFDAGNITYTILAIVQAEPELVLMVEVAECWKGRDRIWMLESEWHDKRRRAGDK